MTSDDVKDQIRRVPHNRLFASLEKGQVGSQVTMEVVELLREPIKNLLRDSGLTVLDIRDLSDNREELT